MKKYIFTLLCALVATAMNAQDVMVIEKNDNTTAKFNLDDIRRVYFEDGANTDTPSTSTSQLTCRLKDKNGNPVLLTACGNWKYSYTDDGKIIFFGAEEDIPDEHFVVDGLTFKSEKTYDRGSMLVIEGTLELSQDGLIAKAIIVLTEFRANGVLASKYSTTHSFVYDAEKQLQKVDAETNDERYDESGIISRSGSGKATLEYSWTNGNLQKVEITEDEGSMDHLYKNKVYTYSYSEKQNITRQPLACQCHIASDIGINHLYRLGLLGVGPSNLPTGVSFTLNDNGTIDTEDNKQYTYAQP